MFVTLIADGTGGGWAYGPRPDATPPTVQPADLLHVTLPLCAPHTHDGTTVGQATTTLTENLTAALTTGTSPPQAEHHLPTVLLLAVPAHHLAVAIGVFTDTPATQQWWNRSQHRLTLPGLTATIYTVIATAPTTSPLAAAFATP